MDNVHLIRSILRATYEARTSQGNRTNFSQDLSSFTLGSRCSLHTMSSTPADVVILNLVGIALNELLREARLVPVNDPEWNMTYSISLGLMEMVRAADLRAHRMDDARENGCKWAFTSHLANIESDMMGMPVLDNPVNSFRIYRDPDPRVVHVLCNQLNANTRILDIMGVVGKVCIIRMENVFIADPQNAPAVANHAGVQFRLGKSALFLNALEVNGNRVASNAWIEFRGQLALTNSNAWTGGFSVRLEVSSYAPPAAVRGQGAAQAAAQGGGAAAAPVFFRTLQFDQVVGGFCAVVPPPTGKVRNFIDLFIAQANGVADIKEATGLVPRMMEDAVAEILILAANIVR